MGVAQPRRARAQATRAALIDAARRLFVEKGYHGAGTEEIVAVAGVGTRGALYHHFVDKQALFLAVFEAVQADLLGSTAARVRPADAFGQLRAGLMSFLDASLTPEVQRVLLLDGPAVLGWETWRSLEQRYGLGVIRDLLARAIEEGTVRPQPLEALAHLLLAVIDEAAMFVVHSGDFEAARGQAAAAVDALLGGLRVLPAPTRSRSRTRATGEEGP